MCGITAYGTCDGNGAGGLCGVDDVISVMLSTEMVAAALVSTEWVEVVVAENGAGVIGACDGGIKGCICGEVRTRDVDGEVAAGINGA